MYNAELLDEVIEKLRRFLILNSAALYIQDVKMVEQMIGIAQSVKSRWIKCPDPVIKTEKVGHWSGPSKAYVENKGAEHVE